MIYRKINSTFVLLLPIIVLAAFFRFYNLYSWTFFGMDQEYEAFLIKNILSFHHLPLIGVNASDTGLYLGPAFIYIASFPYLFFSGNPIGGSILASILGVISTFFIYKLGKLWFSETVGLLASFFWAVSFLPIYYDRQFWNPTPIPLLTILVLYSLTKVITGRSNYLPVLAIAFGLALQSHLQSVIFLPIIFVYLIKYKKNYSKKILLLFLLILLLFQTPLILFDLRHNFTNLKALFHLIVSNQTSISSTLISRVNILQNMIGRALFINGPVDLFVENGQCQALVPYIGKTIGGISLLVFIILLFYIVMSSFRKDKTIKDHFLIPVITSFTVLVLILYKKNLFEYYFLYFLPLIFLLVSWFLAFISNKGYKIIAVFIILGFVYINFGLFFSSKMHFSYADKASAIRFSSNYVDNGNFSLEALGGCGIYGGYRYLFEYYGKKPGSSYMDAYFSWLYGTPRKQKFPKSIVFILIDNRERSTLVKWLNDSEILGKKVIKTGQFGNIKVLVIDNETNQNTYSTR